ncbi:hypothetical protein AAV94_04300 [Lampropedia cohaerens]|uniref:tRNA 5-methylaminomethyl-2-thiouridine biosynthesis bifunctional protein MnmC n=1 Tax=Lampropedia cohaerens TaxID=1610491 RepID=A0A0U1Q1H2_9BURK|nr:tRNA (5-methylaminomethyl-2-thiouridine)(34)-methyltransferase MnmD [Lampropedia cohaerens]KKW68591.1 hypothetical protein AAV94_04300 [Lampropedia cohaerens]
MSELDWLADGSPYSPRFEDRYHSHQDGGLTQSRSSFLNGCGLPRAWQSQSQWRVLETGFGLGLNFLVTWHAWRADLQRCTCLHFISTEAYPVSASALLSAARQRYPALLPLAQQLAAQYAELDLRQDVHRLRFDGGRVLLTLAIGDARQWLRSEGWQADSIYLDGFNPAKNPDIWSADTLKAVARCSVPGHTQLATWCVARSVRDALAQCGFQVERVPGTPPKKHNLRARYAPAWPVRKRPGSDGPPLALPAALRNGPQRHCVVIGSGIAGACMARNMAEHGWHVTVLERGPQPASGASALPAGLFAPHISPDDAPLSRLSRAGVRAMRHAASQLLRHGIDWQDSGVLEHRIGKKLGLPAADRQIGPPSSRPALQEEVQACGLPPEAATAAVLHTLAGWLRPAALVQACLAHPAIRLQTGCAVRQVTRAGAHPSGRWQLEGDNGLLLAQADVVVIATAFDALTLLRTSLAGHCDGLTLPLNAVRGQVAWGHCPADAALPLPARPVNGKGSFVCVPTGGLHDAKRLWISGGTFERAAPTEAPDEAAIIAAMAANRARLAKLMPATGQSLADMLFATPVSTWGGVRCTVPDRTPVYGPVLVNDPTLLVAAGLGARGLTLAWLCAEVLTAQLHAQPLPVAADLARRIGSLRFADAPHSKPHQS